MATDQHANQILQVVETSGLYLLRIDGEEGIGHVLWENGSRELGRFLKPVLATNEPLRKLWASPSGALWVASANGSVGTTAEVQWPPMPKGGADYLTLGDSPKWSSINLPRVGSTGLSPNVTALWGTADDDVYAGAFGGHIARWDGTSWTQVFDGPGKGGGTIYAFGGTAGDVYAVGKDGTALHFDGSSWKPFSLPGPANGHEMISGIARMSDGAVVLSCAGNAGRLLRGSAANGFAEVLRAPVQLIGMAQLGERLLFATGDGVAELVERDVTMIKSNLKTVSISEGKGRVFLIEPTQPLPQFCEYDPRQTAAPWWRKAF